METYDPTAIVLQCGADSLSGDRLGCFNLSLEGHADCVEFMKSFNRPLLLLGGGGYTVRNVARCWTAETAVALDTELDQQLPFTDYYEYFGPDYCLPIVPSNTEDLNPPEELKRIQEILLRNLEALENKPSVPFQERADDMPTTFAAGGASADEEPDPDARVNSSLSPPSPLSQQSAPAGKHACARACTPLLPLPRAHTHPSAYLHFSCRTHGLTQRYFGCQNTMADRDGRVANSGEFSDSDDDDDSARSTRYCRPHRRNIQCSRNDCTVAARRATSDGDGSLLSDAVELVQVVTPAQRTAIARENATVMEAAAAEEEEEEIAQGTAANISKTNVLLTDSSKEDETKAAEEDLANIEQPAETRSRIVSVADGVGTSTSSVCSPVLRKKGPQEAGQVVAFTRVKEERDGGWPAEFQAIRKQPFNEHEYGRLHSHFFREYEVTAGVRESRTRNGTLRTTCRVTGTTSAIAEWPRIRSKVEQMHKARQFHDALKHLRCLEHYMQQVVHVSLPRIMRLDGGDFASGFVDGEHVDLAEDDNDGNSHPEAIDVEALEAAVLGIAIAPAQASTNQRGRKRIKTEK
jgi:hypothetical protein